MRDLSISTKVLVTETLRRLPKILLFVALLALACAVMYFAFGSSKPFAALVAVFYALVFFAAPFASSSVRAKRKAPLFTLAGGKTLLFCFGWGCVVVAGFIATLQLWQGMGATAFNYVVAMGFSGLACAAVAAVPSGY